MPVFTVYFPLLCLILLKQSLKTLQAVLLVGKERWCDKYHIIHQEKKFCYVPSVDLTEWILKQNKIIYMYGEKNAAWQSLFSEVIQLLLMLLFWNTGIAYSNTIKWIKK